MKRALVSGDAKGEVSNVRTNSVGWVSSAGDPVLEGVEDRICELFGCEPEVRRFGHYSQRSSSASSTPASLTPCPNRLNAVHGEFSVHPLRR